MLEIENLSNLAMKVFLLATVATQFVHAYQKDCLDRYDDPKKTNPKIATKSIFCHHLQL